MAKNGLAKIGLAKVGHYRMTSPSVVNDRRWNFFLIRQMPRKHEIKKQMTGEGADLDKSGRILNRVIEWGRDGITIEADQRHVREMLRGFELERANPAATPCAVENNSKGHARDDESEGENPRGRRRPSVWTARIGQRWWPGLEGSVPC